MWRAVALASIALCGCRSVIGIDEPGDNIIPCASADDCGGPYPYCHRETAKCVACAENRDCSSSLCGPNGTCIDEIEIAYASQDGAGGACTRAAPCRFQTAVDSGVSNVLVEDAVVGGITINHSVRIFRGPAGELHNPLNDLPALTVFGPNTVEIYGLPIFGDGIRFGSHGVDVAGKGSVVLLVDMEIANHGGAGVVATGGEVTILRCRIHDNDDGGVRMVAPTKFSITNNFVYNNGTPASSGGGVYLNGDGLSVFAFNTVVGNTSYAQSPYVGGIACFRALAQNNLVYGNIHGADPAQISGSCAFDNTLFGVDAAIVQFTPGDYHLTDATPAPIRDAVECTGFDIDHDRRPLNGECDIGADEFSP